MPTSFTDLERGKGLSAAAALGTTAASLPSTPLLARVCWGKAVPPLPCSPSGAGMSLPLGGKGWDRWPWLPVQSRWEWSPFDPCNGKITNIFHFKAQLNIQVLWLQAFPHFPGVISKFLWCPCLLKCDSAFPSGKVETHTVPRWPAATSDALC